MTLLSRLLPPRLAQYAAAAGKKERPPGTYAIWAMEAVGASAAFLYYLHLHTDLLKPKVDCRLSPTQYTPLKLLSVEPLTHDTSRFRFLVKRPRFDGDEPEKQADETMATGAWAVDVKDHLVQTSRMYTPVAHAISDSVDEASGSRSGHLDLVVKRYDRGSLSRFIHGTRVGDHVEMRGPLPVWPYTANQYKHIYMIAGGTGVAPMFQVIERVLADPQSQTAISLLYGSRSPEDILLRDELDALQKKHGQRLHIQYLVDHAGGEPSSSSSTGAAVSVGMPNRSTVEAFTRAFDKQADVVLVCGPDPMMNAISGVRQVGSPHQGPLRGVLADLGFSPKSVFKF
ncbi:hypothetical protein GGI07_004177 [Coemansia sp. Benny D115]|nr:hypothetical protein GGI07_004177 [Coemansia sp. Benny D115]